MLPICACCQNPTCQRGAASNGNSCPLFEHVQEGINKRVGGDDAWNLLHSLYVHDVTKSSIAAECVKLASQSYNTTQQSNGLGHLMHWGSLPWNEQLKRVSRNVLVNVSR